MSINEWLLVFSTLAGPVLAVQAQKWIERAREKKARKARVFETLMATRGSRLSADHVRALNMIDVTFFGVIRFGRPWRTEGDQAVLDAWKEYLDHLSTTPAPGINLDVLTAQRDELFVNLLSSLAVSLDYSFDRVELRKSWYSPVAHGKIEELQATLLESAVGVFSGARPLIIAPAKAD